MKIEQNGTEFPQDEVTLYLRSQKRKASNSLPYWLTMEDLEKYKIPLETICQSATHYYEAKDGKYINRPSPESGVYFLFADEELVYVGQATSLCWRLQDHSKSDMVWNRGFYLEIQDGWTRSFVEAVYIDKYRPVYNWKIERVPRFAKNFLAEK